MQRQTAAPTTTSPPRPPQCQIHSPCPNNIRRPLSASIKCSSSSSHTTQVRPGHAFGLARSIPACTRRPRPPPPLHPHLGLWHHGKHMPADLQARACRSVAHLKPQTSSLACGSAGGVAVAGKPASCNNTAATVLFVPHRHTRQVLTKQQYELLHQAVELLW